MIVVREYFIAKPGKASKLAGMMKDLFAGGQYGKVRVLTDVTGRFNRVVLETEVESLADFEKRMEEYSKSDELKQKMKGYTDLYLVGGREIYRVW